MCLILRNERTAASNHLACVYVSYRSIIFKEKVMPCICEERRKIPSKLKISEARDQKVCPHICPKGT